MAKRKRMTPEDWAYAEARLERLREHERRITAEIEARKTAEATAKPGWRRLFRRA